MHPKNGERSTKVLSLAQLKEIKNKSDAEMAASSAVEAEDSSEEADDDEPSVRPQARAVKFNLGSLAAKKVKKKTNQTSAAAKAKGKALAAPPPKKAVAVSGSSGTQQIQDRDDSPQRSNHSQRSSLKQGPKSKTDKLLEEAEALLHHDPELLRVAKKHIGTSKGSAVKCLSCLSIQDIMSGNRPGNSMTGVRGSKVCCAVVHFSIYQLRL